jgi:hypothetical protein
MIAQRNGLNWPSVDEVASGRGRFTRALRRPTLGWPVGWTSLGLINYSVQGSPTSVTQ